MLVALVAIFTVLSFLFHSESKKEDENEEYQKMDNYVLYYHKPSGYYYESVSFDYPEHVLTWEGYGNQRVSLCVCV